MAEMPSGASGGRAEVAGVDPMATEMQRRYQEAVVAFEQWQASQEAGLEELGMEIQRLEMLLSNPNVARATPGTPVLGFADGGVMEASMSMVPEPRHLPGYAQGTAGTPRPYGYLNGRPVYQGPDGRFYFDAAAPGQPSQVTQVPPQFVAQITPAFDTAVLNPIQASAQTRIDARPPSAAVGSGMGAGGLGGSMAAMSGAAQESSSGLVPPPPQAGPPPISAEFQAALDARRAAEQQERQGRTRDLAFSEALHGERFSEFGRAYAQGGVHDDLSGTVPPPPMAGMGMEPNAIVGEAPDRGSDRGGELVIDRQAIEQGLVRYVETPLAAPLSEGSVIIPVPPHMENDLRGAVPPMGGEELSPMDDEGEEFMGESGRRYMTGGMVPAPPKARKRGKRGR